jgi:hypothetical protein
MLIVDIETVPLPDVAQWLEPVEAPSNYKDPDKIAAYLAAERKKQIEKAALDPDLCQIVAIGLWRFARDVVPAWPEPVVLTTEFDHEQDLLKTIWREVGEREPVVGFNIQGFDLPVLLRRSLYLGVTPRAHLSVNRYRPGRVIDLMQRLAFEGAQRYRSLTFYCQRFGITVEDDVTGADTAALVAAGDWDRVLAHCRADLRKTKALAVAMGVWTAPPAEHEAGVF